MEQKQLDELDETPLEEYIEEEDEVENYKAQKKAIKKPKKNPWKEESPSQEESPVSDDELIDSTSAASKTTVSNITASKVTVSKTFSEVEKVPINPWANHEEKSSTSKMWIILSVILAILLLIAIFTGGFGMLAKKNSISQTEAEQRVLGYVNTELLMGETKATIVSSADAGDQYMITLAVGSETVDTYITKDGQMFFPQGFAISNAGPLSPTSPTTQNQPTEPSSPTSNNPVATQPADPSTPAKPARTIEINLAAKKWVFTPTQMNARSGDHIKLTINPTALDFTFTIPELNIEREITKASVIEFDVPTSGNYTFNCASCEEYRGMTGKIIVE